MNKFDLRDLRRKNLLALIDKQFNGSQAEFSDAAKKNPTQVNHWISGHRNPNGDTCREVERALGLPLNYLDQESPALDAQLYTGGTNQALGVVDTAGGAMESGANVGHLLDQLGTLLEKADTKTRNAVADLLLRYAQDPADGQRLKMAIEVLLAARSDDSKP